jgi:hypothetical protein
MCPDRHSHSFSSGPVQSKPGNWEELLRVLEGPRPEIISERTFAPYCRHRNKVDKPCSHFVMTHVFPILQGECDDPSEEDVEFGNLIPLPPTNEIVPARPGLYHGEQPLSIHPNIRAMLQGSIGRRHKSNFI